MSEIGVGKYKKVQCPLCGKVINLMTLKTVNYDLRQADNKAWCYECGKYFKFSLKA